MSAKIALKSATTATFNHADARRLADTAELCNTGWRRSSLELVHGAVKILNTDGPIRYKIAFI